jgi:ribonuclease P protein component
MYTFTKEERLCSKRLLDKLFHNGSSFLVYPFRIVSLQEHLSVDSPVQVVIAVSKKKFKRAVDRNLIKRRIKEAYRLHKQEYLYNHLSSNKLSLLLGIHYVGKEIADYSFMEKKLKQALQKLVSLYEHTESN